jgi:DNA-binding TFAR19-related protein (PDSD5 family)
MSEEDKELEALKARRLAEMKKNVFSQAQKQQPQKIEKPASYREYVISKLGYRGMEVLQNAEAQYPKEAPLVIEKLGELIHSGEINEEIDGGKLLALFRSIGINVKIETKISIEQDGKFVSLSDKLKNKEDQDDSRNI